MIIATVLLLFLLFGFYVRWLFNSICWIVVKWLVHR